MASESEHIVHVKADLSDVEALVAKMQVPSVGRVVHYVSYGSPVRPDGSQAFTSQCRAADITEVDPADPTLVGLMVKNPTGLFFRSLADGGCQYDEPYTSTVHPLCGGTWHWPERV